MMPKALIIADQPDMIRAIEADFSMLGWSSNSIGVAAMLGRNSRLAREYRCMVLLVDADFCMRFGPVMEEIGGVFRNCSHYSTLYLLLEQNCQLPVASWLKCRKRLFNLSTHGYDHAIREIDRLESDRAFGAIVAHPISLARGSS